MVEHKDMHSMWGRGAGRSPAEGGAEKWAGAGAASAGGCGAGPHQVGGVAGAGRAVRLGTRWVPSA